MSRIQELIKGKCPNGVKFFKLSDIGYQYNGLSGKTKNDFENGNCKYITYSNIYNNPSVKLDINDYVSVKDCEQQNEIKFKDILVTGSSENLEDSGMISLVTEVPKEKMFLNSFSFGFRLNEEFYDKYNASFLKHLFRDSNFRSKIISCSFGVTRYNLSKKKFLKIHIPLPPLEVQEEIVRILDKFGELEAELEAELEVRKQQYEFWRVGLLSEEKNHGKYKKYNITELCNEIFAGGDVPDDTIKGLQSPEGEYIYPVISNGVGINAIYGYSKNYKVDCKSCVTIAARGTIGYHDVRYGKFTPIIRLITLIPNEKIATAKYLNYVLYNHQFKSFGGGIPQLTIPTVRQLSLFIPSLEEQQRIVNILDKFDKLVNDISEGLPAEIELRRKQYEYYRNKLLSFKELKVND